MPGITSKNSLQIDKGKDTKNPYDILKRMYLNESRRMFPNVPDNLRTTPDYTDKTLLESIMCITDFIRLSGGEADRINCIKRKRDNRIIQTDILALIQGRKIMIKVKRENKLQCYIKKYYQEQDKRIGGLYLIARDFEQFFSWYLSKFGRTENETE